MSVGLFVFAAVLIIGIILTLVFIRRGNKAEKSRYSKMK